MSVYDKIIEEHNKCISIDILKNVNNNIIGRKFHNHTYILYDLRTLLGKEKKTYLEIGSYVGSSASLILQHEFKTDVYCIDPCVLDSSHYGAPYSQFELLDKNLKNNNKHGNNVTIYKNYSTDYNVLEEIKKVGIGIDILFIDGDHSCSGVKKDWYNYEKFVNSGGYIVFDDYNDKTYSPEVKIAVDDIVNSIDTTKYEIIGAIENIHKLNGDDPTYKNKDYINEFIIYKI